MIINILGTDYRVEKRTEEQDLMLETCDGYCDPTVKLIVTIERKRKGCDCQDFECFRKKALRHEIIHAFLNESGLMEDWKHESFGQEETTVDWIAIQFPKILKAFQDAGCI